MVNNPFRDPAVNVAVGADTDQFNQGIDAATDRLGGLKMAAGAAGAAVAALGVGAMAKSVQVAAEFEEAMVEVEKVTSPETAAAMGDSIQEMATEIPLAQNRLAGLAADAGRFGIEGPEAIERFTESAAKMAEATNLSANKAGESLARLSELTNTPISEVENLGSSINSLSNNFATSSQEIVDSMLRASASLGQLGLNQREIAGLSAALNEVSESSERAGTRLRRVGQELLDPKKASEVAAALGMTSEEFETMRDESPVELIRQMAAIMGEGGDRANALREILSTTSRQALSGLSQNLDGVTDAQERANRSFEEGESLQREFEAATDTFNARLQLFQNRLQNIGIQIGNAMLPALTDLLDLTTPLIEDFAALNEETDGLAGAATLAAASIGGLAAAAGLFIGPLAGAAVLSIGGFSAAVAVLNEHFVDLDELLITVKDTATDAFDTINQATAGVQDAFRENITGENGIITNARTAFNALENNIIIPATDGIESAWSTFGADIQKVAEGAFGAIRTTAEIEMDAVGTALNTVLDVLSGDFEGAFTNIKDFVIDTVEEITEFLLGDGKTALEGAVGIFDDVFGGIADGVKDALSYLTELSGDTLISDITDTIRTGMISVRSSFSYLTGTGSGTLIGDITNALSNAGQGIGNGIRGAINDALGLPFKHTIGKVEVAGETVFSGQTINIPALAEGGLIEESGLAFVDEGERFSGAPGAAGAEVDQSGGMMLSQGELRDAVAEGVARAAGDGDLFGAQDIVRAIEENDGETTIELRDGDRYRTARR